MGVLGGLVSLCLYGSTGIWTPPYSIKNSCDIHVLHCDQEEWEKDGVRVWKVTMGEGMEGDYG